MICDSEYQLDIKTSKCLKKNNLDDNDNEPSRDVKSTNLRCGENHIIVDSVCIN